VLEGVDTISICCWIKDTFVTSGDNSWHRIGGIGQHKRMHLDVGNTYARLFVSTDGTGGVGNNNHVLSKTAVQDGNWHHICGTLNKREIKIYVDGVLENKTTMTADPYTEGQYLYVGTVENGSRFVGNISDFRLYATVLTAAQVKELYQTSAMVAKNGTMMTYDYIEE
jgi:hypothetical protein